MTYMFSQLPAAARLVILAALCAYFGSFCESRFRGRSIIIDDRNNYAPMMPPMFISAVFILFFFIDLISWHNANSLIQFGLFVVQTAAWIAVFSAILYLITGTLRKRFNAASCSLLWVVLNFLYFHTLRYFGSGLFKPVIRISFDPAVFKWFITVYMLAAAAVFIHGVVRHLVFRRRLLESARPSEHPELNGRLDQIASDLSGRPLHIDLLISPDISSPLSVGVFRKTTYVILPDASYDFDEIDMIFRHEVIHILRMDPQTKLFMLFCCSLLWWDPLMWKGSELCSQDIELSCDEAVLYGADDEEKEKYASLVIESASCDKGFTTCLSARAETLRYRLKRIMEPAVDRSGMVLIAVMMFIVSVSSNLIAAEVPMGTVFQTDAIRQTSVNELSVMEVFIRNKRSGAVSCKELSEDEKSRLVGLLSELQIAVSEEQYEKGDRDAQIDLEYDGGWAIITVHEEILYIQGGASDDYISFYNHPYRITNPEKAQEILSLLGVR